MNSNSQQSQNMQKQDEAGEQVSIAQLQHLVHLLDNSDVSEIEVKRANIGMHLVLRKAKVEAEAAAGGPQTMPVSAIPATSAHITSPIETKHTVTASLVGIFHTRIKSKAAPLIKVGDHVKVGQLVGSIQSLNVINEVESPVAGHIVEIFVQDGQPVEYGQKLMAIDSSQEK